MGTDRHRPRSGEAGPSAAREGLPPRASVSVSVSVSDRPNLLGLVGEERDNATQRNAMQCAMQQFNANRTVVMFHRRPCLTAAVLSAVLLSKVIKLTRRDGCGRMGLQSGAERTERRSTFLSA